MIGGETSGDKLEKVLNARAREGWQLEAITSVGSEDALAFLDGLRRQAQSGTWAAGGERRDALPRVA
jgi:hypothetical protein